MKRKVKKKHTHTTGFHCESKKVSNDSRAHTDNTTKQGDATHFVAMMTSSCSEHVRAHFSLSPGANEMMINPRLEMLSKAFSGVRLM